MGSDPAIRVLGVGGADLEEGGGDLVERGDEFGVDRGEA